MHKNQQIFDTENLKPATSFAFKLSHHHAVQHLQDDQKQM
jgi:hypothetical protein